MAHLTTKHTAVKPGELEQDVKDITAGLSKNFAPTLVLQINGAAVTVKSAVAALRAYLVKSQAVDADRAALAHSLNERNAMIVATNTLVKALKVAIKMQVGPQSPLLDSFGIPMDKARQTDTVTLFAAQGKAAQTREVRGTKGKRQRQAIKTVGDPSVTVTSDKRVIAGPRPVNLPPSPAAANASVPAPAAAPTGTDSGNGTPGSGSTPATA